MKRRLLLFSALFQLICLSLQAQSSCDKWSFGATYMMTQAKGTLSENGYKLNHGVTFDMFYNNLKLDQLTISPGLRILAGVSAGDKSDIVLAEPFDDGYIQEYNAFGDFKFVTRFSLFNDLKFKPYGEIGGGLRISTANQRYGLNTNSDIYEDETDNYRTNYTHVYGFGLGMMFGISDQVDIDLRVNNDWAGSMSHFNLDDVGNTEVYDVQNVHTMSYNVGLRIRFKCNDDQEEHSRSNSSYDNRGNKKPVQKKDTQINKS